MIGLGMQEMKKFLKFRINSMIRQSKRSLNMVKKKTERKPRKYDRNWKNSLRTSKTATPTNFLLLILKPITKLIISVRKLATSARYTNFNLPNLSIASPNQMHFICLVMKEGLLNFCHNFQNQTSLNRKNKLSDN